jgi:hypothetical protein
LAAFMEMRSFKRKMFAIGWVACANSCSGWHNF